MQAVARGVGSGGAGVNSTDRDIAIVALRQLPELARGEYLGHNRLRFLQTVEVERHDGALV